LYLANSAWAFDSSVGGFAVERFLDLARGFSSAISVAPFSS
jgi:hypothetical protein